MNASAANAKKRLREIESVLATLSTFLKRGSCKEIAVFTVAIFHTILSSDSITFDHTAVNCFVV